MKEEFKDGKRFRPYHKDRFWIWVADSGDSVFHYGANGLFKGVCKILKDCRGPFVYESWSGTQIYRENAVMTCFCPPCPKDGKDYMIGYKDGNMMNCNYHNLKWVPYHYQNTTKKKEILYMDGDKYEIFSNGTIKCDGQFEDIYDYWYDDDVDLNYITPEPFVYIGRERIKVYKIMRACGYVQGDDADLQNPVILHRDMNYRNFASDNLEWVEKNDPRYLAYQKQISQDLKARDMEMNGNHPRPEGWINSDQIPPSASIDPITGAPINLQIPPFPGWPAPSSSENPPAPFTPPDFSSFGEAPDVGDNPLKPI